MKMSSASVGFSGCVWNLFGNCG